MGSLIMQHEGLAFASSLVSDYAPVNGLIAFLLVVPGAWRCMRDPTWGGLATTFNEWTGVGVAIE